MKRIILILLAVIMAGSAWGAEVSPTPTSVINKEVIVEITFSVFKNDLKSKKVVEPFVYPDMWDYVLRSTYVYNSQTKEKITESKGYFYVEEKNKDKFIDTCKKYGYKYRILK